MEDLESRYTKLDLYLKTKINNDIPSNIIEELDNLDIRKLELIYKCIKNKLQSEIKKLCGKYKIDNIINFILSIDPNKDLYMKFIEFVEDESLINHKDFIKLYEKIIINHPLITMMKENNYDIDKINKIEEFINFMNNNDTEEELEENDEGRMNFALSTTQT